jgi:flagellar basal-body rod protein FlgC
MVPAVNSAMQGLQAYGTKLNSNASNIANVSTERFKKTRVTLWEQAPQGVNTSVETVDSPGNIRLEETPEGPQSKEYSNVDLTEELPNSHLNAIFYQSNLKTLQIADEMTASLLSIKA